MFFFFFCCVEFYSPLVSFTAIFATQSGIKLINKLVKQKTEPACISSYNGNMRIFLPAYKYHEDSILSLLNQEAYECHRYITCLRILVKKQETEEKKSEIKSKTMLTAVAIPQWRAIKLLVVLCVSVAFFSLSVCLFRLAFLFNYICYSVDREQTKAKKNTKKQSHPRQVQYE